MIITFWTGASSGVEDEETNTWRSHVSAISRVGCVAHINLSCQWGVTWDYTVTHSQSPDAVVFLHCGAVTTQSEPWTACLRAHTFTRRGSFCSGLTTFSNMHPPSEANHWNAAYVMTPCNVASVRTNTEKRQLVQSTNTKYSLLRGPLKFQDIFTYMHMHVTATLQVCPPPPPISLKPTRSKPSR